MVDVEVADLQLHSKSRELEMRRNDDDMKYNRSRGRDRDRSPHRRDRYHHREQEVRKRDDVGDDDEKKDRDRRQDSNEEAKYDRTKKRDRERSPHRRDRTHRREQERRKWDDADNADDVEKKDRNRSSDTDGEMQHARPNKRDGERSPHQGDKTHRREQERHKRDDDDVKKKDRNRSPDSDEEIKHDLAKKRDRERSPFRGDRAHRREQERRKRDDDDDDVKNKDRSRSLDSHEEMQYDQAKKRDRERSPHRRDRTRGMEQERWKRDDDVDTDARKHIDRSLHSDEEMKHDRPKKRDRERSPHRGGKAHRRKPERQKRDVDDSNEDDVKKDRNTSLDSDEEMQYDRAKKRDRERSPHRGDKAHHREQEKKNREKDAKEETKEEHVAVQQMPDAGMIKTGGIYIPPHRMAQMMREVQDKSSEQYQRLSWDALRKSINGLVNKVNATNTKNIIPELFSENLIRGRGLFCRSCMKSQMASPGFTDVFAALVAVVNTKFPEVGKLLLNRIVLQLRRAYKRNDKPQLLAATKFVAHLVNQQVAHEIIALELLTLLLEKPTDDSVEVAVGFVKECGALLQDFSPQGLHGIFERFRAILHEGEIDKRVQFLIEGLFAIRKAKFQGFPAVRPELDLVEQEDQFTHEVSLEDEIDPETSLDVFKPNPQFLEDEKAYEDLKKSILGDESSDNEEGSDAASDDEDDEESEEDEEENMEIKDETETNLVNLRRTIYLTIMSSVDFEEAGHKLLKIKLEPGQEMELCIMLLECCSQERTYLRYYGLLGQRFCMINKVHQENFEKCFVQQYSMIHRLETNKLRNVAKFFAHLLGTSALPWHVLAYIRLTEEDTTSSSRIFIKILFQELSEHLGIRLLNERLNDPTMLDSFESIFPKDNPKNTRFSINFFTSIGLGGITESLREYLKNMPRLIMQQQKPLSESDDDNESSASGSSSSETDSSSESESDSSSDESKRRSRRRKRRKN